MREHIYLGSTPAGEPCAQYNTPSYFDQAMAETGRYIRVLKKLFPNAPEGIQIKRIYESHTHSRTVDVGIYFNPEVKEQVDYAYNVERNLPFTWPPCEHKAIDVQNRCVNLDAKCEECGADLNVMSYQ